MGDVQYPADLKSTLAWMHFTTQIDFFTAKWGPAGAFGGPNPVVGCRAFGALPIGRGDVGFTEPGCELADFGGPFASSVEANNWFHFVYGTAEGPLLWKKSEYSSACIMDSQLGKCYVGAKSWPQCKTSNALCWLVMALEL